MAAILNATEPRPDVMLAGSEATGLVPHTGWRLVIYANNGTLIGGSINVNGTHTFNLYSGPINLSGNLGVVFGPEEAIGFEAVNAFDQDVNTRFAVNRALDRNNPMILGKIFDTAITPDRYLLGDYSNPLLDIHDTLRSFKDWEFQYSDDSTNGTDGTWLLASKLNNQTQWYPGELRTYSAEPINNLRVVEGNDIFTTRGTIFLPILHSIRQNVLCEFFGNTLSSVVIPVTSFSMRINFEGASTVDLKIPDAPNYESILKAFKEDEGTLIFTYTDILADFTQQSGQSGTFTITSVASFIGARTNHINVSAEFTYTLTETFNTILLENVSLLRINPSGSVTVRSKVDRRVVPNDVVIYENIPYYARSITQVYTKKSVFMEITTNPTQE